MQEYLVNSSLTARIRVLAHSPDEAEALARDICEGACGLVESAFDSVRVEPSIFIFSSELPEGKEVADEQPKQRTN
jgi:hypothetical protein